MKSEDTIIPLSYLSVDDTNFLVLTTYLAAVQDSSVVGVLILVLGVDHHHQVRQPHLLLEGHVGRAEYLRLPVPGVAELPTFDGGSVGHMDQAGTYNIVQSVQVYRTGYHSSGVQN